jgi:fatty acid-binding protein DegV
VASDLRGKLAESSRVVVIHAAAPRQAERLAEEIQRRAQIEQLTMTEVTSVMAVHTGPGFVGAAAYSRSEENL